MLPGTSSDKASEKIRKSNRHVTFAEVDKNETRNDILFSGENGSDVIMTLRKRISDLRMELKSEKSLRKREDRNLVKLAQELNKRIDEANEKEVKVQELMKTINDLESKVQNRYHETKQDFHVQFRAYQDDETRILELDTSVTKLRQQLFDATIEADNLRAKLAANVIMQTKKEEIFRNNLRDPFSTSNVIVIILSVAVATLFLGDSGLLSLNAVCSPIIPGKYLETGTFDAPWWAPATLKAEMFHNVCGRRPRTRISLKNNKMRLSEISNASNEAKLLWHGQASHGVVVGSKSIHIKTKGGTIQVAAPWSI